ncbi:MAG: hypothetical protein IPK19_37420 [Chloroflexi bacterium]|nr:hypothetical protein [Chloroflexota bacterium]
MGLLGEAYAQLNASAGAAALDDSPAAASNSGGRLMRILAARPVIALYLILLVLYVVLGVPSVTFHGDEAMQIYMSSDYATAILEGAPEKLLSYPRFPSTATSIFA